MYYAHNFFFHRSKKSSLKAQRHNPSIQEKNTQQIKNKKKEYKSLQSQRHEDVSRDPLK
jgi:hypothetical protein